MKAQSLSSHLLVARLWSAARQQPTPLSVVIVMIAQIALVPAWAMAADSQRVVRAECAPVLDGRLDDDCWLDALRFRSFRAVKDRSRQPAPPTLAMLTYDDAGFYIAFHCEEPDDTRPLASVEEHDGPVWQEDCVEVFLGQRVATLGYAHVAVNVRGIARDAWRSPEKPEDLGWDSGVTVQVHREERAWTAELHIPFDCFPMVGQPLDWSVQLARTRSRPPYHLTMLSAPVTTYHMPQHFEALRGIELHDQPVQVLDASLGEVLPGLNRPSIHLRNNLDEHTEVTVRLDPTGSEPLERVVTLPPLSEATCDVPWSVEPEVNTRVRLTTHWRGRYVGGLDQPLVTGPALGEPARVHTLPADEPLTITVPVSLSADSQRSAELQWELVDSASGGRTQGGAPVEGPEARLWLGSVQPGHYALNITLRWDKGGAAHRISPLFAIESPFAP